MRTLPPPAIPRFQRIRSADDQVSATNLVLRGNRSVTVQQKKWDVSRVMLAGASTSTAGQDRDYATFLHADISWHQADNTDFVVGP